MPPKAKKGKDAKAKDENPVEPPPKTPEPTEKEILLQNELDKVTAELENSKTRVDELRSENDWLQEEANKVRIESHEYMSYMEKKTSKRQTTIITLSDHNKQEIQNIHMQKQMMEDEFEKKREALKSVLLEKQHLLEKTGQELNQLQEYKLLQTEQLNRIQELEREVTQMRARHSDTIQQLKSRFLTDKHRYKQDAYSHIQALEKAANKEAVACLTDHTNRIKCENRTLRRELMGLIHQTRALHQHQKQLEEQRRQLVREQQYADDLRQLRSTQWHKTGGIVETDDLDESVSIGHADVAHTAIDSKY